MLPESRQKGVIFLALVLVLFVTGGTVVLGVLNNRQTSEIARLQELSYQMAQAKSTLLAYVANSATLQNNLIGPGFFPCPDTDGTDDEGYPDTNCDSNVALVGRLPEYVDVDGTSDFRLNDYYADSFSDVDQQFWYVVAPRYVYNLNTTASRRARTRTSTDPLQSYATPYRLYLDDESEYVALIIAPGEELDSQDRTSGPNDFANFIEVQNGSSGFDFYTTYAANPDEFNDRVVGITLDEWMLLVGPKVVRAMKLEMDEFYANDGESDGDNDYPQSHPAVTELRPVFSDDHLWLRYNAAVLTDGNYEYWVRDTIWTRLGTAEGQDHLGTLSFRGCTGITFSLDATVDGFTTLGTSC